MNLCLGSLYAWSVFLTPLQDEFAWTRTQVSSVFSTSLAVFCLTVLAFGAATDRRSSRALALTSAVFASAGLLASAATTSLTWLVVSYGVVFGIGNGIGYVTAIGATGRAFPTRRGLAIGIVVGSYAAGPLLVAPLAGAGIAALGWRWTLAATAAVVAVLMSAGAGLLGGHNAAAPTAAADTQPSAPQIAPRQLVLAPSGWALWAVFFLGGFPGLMAVGHLAAVIGDRGLSPAVGTTAVALLAAGNAAGRALASWASDHLGRAVVLYGVLGMASAAGGILALSSRAWLLLAAGLGAGFAYGAVAAIVPAATADLFGAEHMGGNFALVFTAWGAAGFTAPLVAARLFEISGSYLPGFLLAGGSAAVGLGAARLLSRVRPPTSPAN